MPRTVQVHTALGAEHLKFRAMRGTRRPLATVRVRGGHGQHELQPRPEDAAGHIAHHRAAGRRRTALPQRHRGALRARGPRQRNRPPLRLPRTGAALALVPHAHHRLPHLPEQERARGARRRAGQIRLPVREAPGRQLPPVGILRAVPGERLRLREPPHGARRHRLPLRARQRRAPAGAGRRHRRLRQAAGLRHHSLPSARSRGQRDGAVHRPVAHLRADHLGPRDARRLRLQEVARLAAKRAAGPERPRAFDLRSLRMARRLQRARAGRRLRKAFACRSCSARTNWLRATPTWWAWRRATCSR
jgi:hypothetical protein